jgi:hypothetical protein
MYVFVRFTGYVLVIFGLLSMVIGFIGAVCLFIQLFIQKDMLINALNSYMLSTGGKSVFPQDVMPYFALIAVVIFLSGLLTAAFGQLMLVFADIGSNSRETNILLRSLRNRGQ